MPLLNTYDTLHKMKKITKLVIAFWVILLSIPVLVVASPVNVNRLDNNHIEPLQVADFIKGSYFTATTTTATSTFPNASITTNLVRPGFADGCATWFNTYLITSAVACGSGSGGYPFTTATNFGTTTSSTSTPLWLRGNAYSLFASSTSVFDYASTTALTVFGNEYVGGTLKLTSNGSSASPIIQVGTTNNTGIYFDNTPGFEGLGFAYNGLFSFHADNFGLLTANGTVQGPSYSFIGAPFSGLYSPVANEFSASVNGVEKVRFGTTGIGVGTTTPWGQLSVGSHNLAITTPSFVVASSSTGVATTTQFIVRNQNVGIGTSTPGTILSIGDTGANTINISATATSTFGSGINLRTGCFAINGVCVSSSSSSSGGNSKWATSSDTTSIYPNSATKVGIGTTSPGTTLSVEGVSVLGNSATAGFFNATNTSATSTFQFTKVNNRFAGGVETAGGTIDVGTGGFVWGSAVSGGSLAKIVSSGAGSIAGGSVTSGSLAAPTIISSTGNASFAQGYVESASFSTNQILSSGAGSFAIGGVVNAGGSRQISSSNTGSLAGGIANAGNITSTGLGSFAWGDNVNATANLATAIGSTFTNSTANSFRVGYTSTPIFNVLSTAVGLGSTTPGTTLSIGDTGANTINISPTATSTFGSGINIRTGCFAINGTCLSTSGGGGSQTPWTSNIDGAGFNLTNAGSLTHTFFSATSTTATSTIVNSLAIGTTTSNSKLEVNGSAHVELQRLSTSTSMTVDFCVTNNMAVMGVGSSNIAFSWTNANRCPGKAILLSNYTPLTGLIGTTTFSGGTNSGTLIWDGNLNPGSSVVNGTTDDLCFVSTATTTSYIAASLCGQH